MSTELTPANTDAPIPLPSDTPTSTPPLPCTPEHCTYSGHFWLERPIPATHMDRIDVTYRYGSTQEGARPTHRGVEFVNEEGTPVLASAAGTVLVAGNDNQQAYADFPLYYGNLVIIEHHFPEMEQPVFTLYGHLSEVLVQTGDQVQTGDRIGSVGYTGVAEWSHLHFEVRLGENRIYDTRNPELWLKPLPNEEGVLDGTIAGRIVDEFGAPIYIPNVVIERVDLSGEVVESFFVESYADISVNGDDLWGENFAISDLAPGNYRVSFVARGLQTWDLEVFPGQLTLLVFDAARY